MLLRNFYFLFPLLLLIACEDDQEEDLNTSPDQEEVQKSIGPDGGSLETPDGKLRLEIPPGALAQETEISITPLTAYPNEMGAILEGTVYAFSPTGLQFSIPAKVSITKPAGSSEQASWYRLEGQQWKKLTAGTQQASTIDAEMSGFSTYGVGDIELIDLTLLIDSIKLDGPLVGQTEINADDYSEHDLTLDDLQEEAMYAVSPICLEENPSEVTFFWLGGNLLEFGKKYELLFEDVIGPQKVDIIMGIEGSTRDLTFYVIMEVIAEGESHFEEEAAVVEAILFPRLIFDVINIQNKPYYFAVTYRDLDIIASDDADYWVEAYFDAVSCNTYFHVYEQLFSYMYGDEGETVSVPVGTGILAEDAEGKPITDAYSQFVLDFEVAASAFGDGPWVDDSNHKGSVLITFFVDVSLEPVLQ